MATDNDVEWERQCPFCEFRWWPSQRSDRAICCRLEIPRPRFVLTGRWQAKRKSRLIIPGGGVPYSAR